MTAGNIDFLPYIVCEGQCVVKSMLSGQDLSESMRAPSMSDKGIPLFNRLKKILKDVEKSSRQVMNHSEEHIVEHIDMDFI